jgi:hypothetical protein
MARVEFRWRCGAELLANRRVAASILFKRFGRIKKSFFTA